MPTRASRATKKPGGRGSWVKVKNRDYWRWEIERERHGHFASSGGDSCDLEVDEVRSRERRHLDAAGATLRANRCVTDFPRWATVIAPVTRFRAAVAGIFQPQTASPRTNPLPKGLREVFPTRKKQRTPPLVTRFWVFFSTTTTPKTNRFPATGTSGADPEF